MSACFNDARPWPPIGYCILLLTPNRLEQGARHCQTPQNGGCGLLTKGLNGSLPFFRGLPYVCNVRDAVVQLDAAAAIMRDDGRSRAVLRDAAARNLAGPWQSSRAIPHRYCDRAYDACAVATHVQ